jgi:hypothetical protein
MVGLREMVASGNVIAAQIAFGPYASRHMRLATKLVPFSCPCSQDIGVAAEAKLAAQACRATAPPSRTPRKPVALRGVESAPCLASSLQTDQRAAFRELNSANEIGKTEISNM